MFNFFNLLFIKKMLLAQAWVLKVNMALLYYLTSTLQNKHTFCKVNIHFPTTPLEKKNLSVFVIFVMHDSITNRSGLAFGLWLNWRCIEYICVSISRKLYKVALSKYYYFLNYRLEVVPKPWKKSFLANYNFIKENLNAVNPAMAAVLDLWHSSFGYVRVYVCKILYPK